MSDKCIMNFIKEIDDIKDKLTELSIKDPQLAKSNEIGNLIYDLKQFIDDLLK